MLSRVRLPGVYALRHTHALSEAEDRVRTPAEYREEAAGYVRQAETANGGRRIRLLEMAQSCLRLADQAELLQSETRPPEGLSGGIKDADTPHRNPPSETTVSGRESPRAAY
jgi:hypothetical protein